jgi:TRAP-type C4-dicarboxylate transport system permease small subunit
MVGRLDAPVARRLWPGTGIEDRMLKKLDYIIDRVTHILLICSGSITLLMAWTVTYGVVKRYVFHAPDPYAYEVSIIFLLLCAVFAVAGVEKINRNIRNDIICNRFPHGMRVILGVVTPLLALVFCVILTWKSGTDALHALRIHQVSSSPWAAPLAPIKFTIPVGYGLLCIVLLVKLVQTLAQLKTLTRKVEDKHPGV